MAALLDEGIDFVGDPVIGHDEGCEGAGDEEDDAGALPEGDEGSLLHGKVDEIGGAVEDVGDQAEEAELQQALEREGGAEVGPGGEDPSDGDGGEDDVVEDAARLPEAGGVGEGGEEGAEKIRGRGLRGLHVVALSRGFLGLGYASASFCQVLFIAKYTSVRVELMALILGVLR